MISAQKYFHNNGVALMIGYNLINIYFFVMLFTAIYWAVHIKSVNSTGYATFMLALSFAIGIYIFGYAMELNSNTEAQILFWNQFEYLGIPFVSAFWLTAGLMYTGHFARHRVLLSLFIYVIPVITMVLRLTNDYHHLYFATVDFVYQGDKLLLNRIYGPWMFVQSIHSMLMIVITLGLFFVYFMKNREQKIGKIRLIVIASITATIGLLLSYFKPFGFIIDYMAICLPLTCLMVVIAIWKYDFLSAKARARSKAFESNRDAILLVSQQNIIIDYNKMASQLLGELGISLTEGDLDLVFQSAPAFLETLKNGADSTLKWGMEPTERIYEISTRSIDSNHLSQGWIKTIRDVTEAYEWNKRLKRMAMVDELSGLNNRRAFMQKGERIIQEVNQKKDSLHLLMMDQDHFKNINDQFGHLNGDRVINHIGKALKTHYHENSLIARLGGEEFAVLLTGFGDAEIKEKTTRFLTEFSNHSYHDRDKTFHVTVSIGIAKKNELGQTLNALIHMADKALYQAKDNGRNCVVEFTSESL